MNGRKMPRGEAIVFGFLFVGMFCLVTFHEKLQEWNLVLPVIIVFVVAFLSFFVWQLIKGWNSQSDEDILTLKSKKQKDPLPDGTEKPATYQERKRYFFSSIVFVVILLIREFKKKQQISTTPLVFSAIVLAIACVYFLPALIQKLRGKEGEPLFPKAKLQPEQILHMLFGLAGMCFCGFWIYLVLSKTGFWWFSIPGFIVGAFFARLFIAGLRILFRKEKDPGEKHINRRKDKDPWDNLDRGL